MLRNISSRELGHALFLYMKHKKWLKEGYTFEVVGYNPGDPKKFMVVNLKPITGKQDHHHPDDNNEHGQP